MEAYHRNYHSYESACTHVNQKVWKSVCRFFFCNVQCISITARTLYANIQWLFVIYYTQCYKYTQNYTILYNTVSFDLACNGELLFNPS